MDASDWIAGLAFLLALWAAIRAEWIGATRVTKLQLRQLERVEAHHEAADVRLSAEKEGIKADWIIVENVGGAVARNVDFKVQCGGYDPVPPNVRPRHLPIDRLDPDTYERIPVIFAGTCRPPLRGRVSWTDPGGDEREVETTIRLR